MPATPVEKLLRHFGLTCLPFARSVPKEGLLEHKSFVEALERLRLAVESKTPLLLTADPGLGKSTLLGTFGLFLALLFLFIRGVPMLSMAELRELVPSPRKERK